MNNTSKHYDSAMEEKYRRWSKNKEPLFNKPYFDANGDIRLNTPTGYFLISSEACKDYHGFWVEFCSCVTNYSQPIGYFQDCPLEDGENRNEGEEHTKIKATLWLDEANDNTTQFSIKKTPYNVLAEDN